MMYPKDPRQVNRALTDMASGRECLLAVPRVCSHDSSTVVACHSNSGAHGKGKAVKSHDFYSVWGCHACHTWLDQGSASASFRSAQWTLGFNRQIERWREIATNPLEKTRHVDAANWALKRLKARGEI